MLNTLVPLTSSLLSFALAVSMLRRFAERKGMHQLFWGMGMIFYGIGGFCEFYNGAFGWNPLVFRLWYLFGAVLVAAWLGQGTVYLLARPKWAKTLMVLLVLGSLFAFYRVFTAQLDPTLMAGAGQAGSELSGRAIVTPGVRVLTPFFNLYGTLALVGGAAYSAFIFWRKRVLLHRAIGNVLIAVGAMLPAFGGLFSRLQIPGALYLGEFFGVILLFLGFWRATTPMQESAASPATTD
ncbi:MAG: hypothetical protein ACP5QU_00450 [Anaerolineae bacterium]